MKGDEGPSTTWKEKIELFYGHRDAKVDYDRDMGEPGTFPFTRGPYPSMYREKLWTVRQYTGFATPRETNKRFKYMLSHGQTGLSIAFDLPTQIGYDPDDTLSRGEVGKAGVSIASLRDMEELFDGIPIDKVTTSMTINSTAFVLLAMYIALAKKEGLREKDVAGTTQNDILKEFTVRGTYRFPPTPSMRLVTDMIEYSSENLPKWNPISISGYHIREAGSTATQELAFTLADGLCYVDACLERGLKINDFAPRLSFFFNAHNDFFEEIAKYRAARRIWAREMKEREGNESAQKLRFHTQTAGCTLTAQQPLNNIVRVTMQALAAVLGGTQSLHTNSYDEALALPTDESAKLALRTQQIIAHETNVTKTVDPVGGSYYLEWLTNRMEDEARRYFNRIAKLGGALKCVEKGFFQGEIARASYEYQKAVEEGKEKIVGVNCFQAPEKQKIRILKISEKVRKIQSRKLAGIRKERDGKEALDALESLRNDAEKRKNVMPGTIRAVEAYASIGEICSLLSPVFGEHRPSGF